MNATITVPISEMRNAKSLNAENTAFEVEINHPDYGWIPYALNPDDTDMTIDNNALIELIGSDYISYVPPVPLTQDELDAILAGKIRLQRHDRLVDEVDPIVSNPLIWAELTDVKQAEWTQYRTDLLNLPDQAGFPNTVTWPTKP
jgi:hypothetical protein